VLVLGRKGPSVSGTVEAGGGGRCSGELLFDLSNKRG
jgi:hypothetical protein